MKKNAAPISLSVSDAPITDLSIYTVDQLKRWVVDNYQELEQNLYDRVCAAYQEPMKETAERRFAKYCVLSKKQILHALQKTQLRQTRLLQATIYATLHGYNVSANKLMFGHDKPVELFGQEKAFLLQARKLSKSQKETLDQILAVNQDYVENPVYFVKRRCASLAYAHGDTLANFIYNGCWRCVVYTELRALASATLQPKTPTESDEEVYRWNMTSLCLRIIFLLALQCDLPADYFLLPDYSKLAQIDGERLGEREQTRLGNYLLATPEGKAKAMAFLIKQNLP